MPRDLFAEFPEAPPRDLFAVASPAPDAAQDSSAVPPDARRRILAGMGIAAPAAGVAAEPAPADAADWVTPGEGEPGVPVLADFTRSLYPFQRNTKTGEYRAAVPKLFTDMTDSLMSAIFAPGDALAGRMSDIEIDPSTGEILPFNSEMMSRAADMAGWATGGEGVPGRAALVDNATDRVIPRQVTRALEADRVPAYDIGGRVEALGPNATVADVGHNTRALAAAAAALPGDSASAMVDTMAARRAGGNARVRTALDENLGPAVSPAAVQDDLRVGRRALGPEYEAALQGAPPVDASDLAARLDDQVAALRGPAQAVLRDIRGMLNDVETGEVSTDASVLFQVRQAIDGMSEGVEDHNVSRVLTSARHQVNDLLTGAAPGIQAVDAKYRELSRQGAAINDGQAALDSDRRALRPDELAAAVEAGALPQGLFNGPSGEAFRLSQGARAEIERVIGTNANDRVALERLLKGEGDWNRRRLAILFGPERADALFQILSNERRMAQTEAAVLSGAGRRSADAATDGIGDPPASPSVLESAANLRFGTAAAKLARKALGGAASAGRERLRNDIVDIVMGRGGWSAPATDRAPMAAVGSLLAAQPNGAQDDQLYRAILRQ